jgi:hypothetical protein
MKPGIILPFNAALLIGVLGLGLACKSPAQNVFQAYLSMSQSTLLGEAQLSRGRFWFQVDDGQVDFTAIIFPFGPATVSLNPTMSVPGSDVEFTLGAGTATTFSGLHTIVDHNPYLPAEPWLPTGYDDAGNPYYLDAPVIRYGDVYTGHFTLPDGFEESLLSGLGRVEFNSTLSGAIKVASVPEPSTAALGLLTVVGCWCRRRRAAQG